MKAGLCASLPRIEELQGSVRCFLRLTRRIDGRILRFANQGAEDQVLLGEYRECAKI